MHCRKPDLILFTVIFIAILALSVFSLDNDCPWGDDYAAYISEGISIADGYFDEQVKLNLFMHPSVLPKEARSGSLVYVWGYPLIMALVYKLVGFDRVSFSSIIYYKLPSALALALLAGVLFLFLRRRTGRALSFTLAFLFCACSQLRVFINTLYNDVVFLFLVILSLYLIDVFLGKYAAAGEHGTKKPVYIYGAALGIALWFTYETRLSGISILFAYAAACVILCIKRRHKLHRHELLPLLMPVIWFLAPKFISEAILAPATGNTSDVSGATLATICDGLKLYWNVANSWLGYITNDLFTDRLAKYLPLLTSSGTDEYGIIRWYCSYLNRICTTAILLISFAGVITDGIKRDLHITLYALVYIISVCMLPYNQGFRYIYPVLVLVPLYFGCALKRGCALLGKLFKRKNARTGRVISTALAAVTCSLMLVSAISGIEKERSTTHVFIPSGSQDLYYMYAYTPCARETYEFIINNTPTDCVIAFDKPRALYLNTERVSFCASTNGHSLDEADYLMCCAGADEELLTPERRTEFTPVFSNAEFTLYQKNT